MSPAYFEYEYLTCDDRADEKRRENWERAYHSVERVEWVRWLPSVIGGGKPCVNAHVRTGGTAMKAEYIWIVPLTFEQHEELHRIGIQSFSAKYNIDLDAAARMVEIQWQSYLSQPRPAW